MATTSLTNKLATIMGSSIGDFAVNTAQQAINGVMGHNANLASAQGQQAAAQFNQASANAATNQNVASMANQYQFNAAQALNANEYSTQMWDKAAAFNEEMWERQAAFNAEQAQIQRDWQERMANTQYQRAVGDMEKAGLNPILAVTGGGVGTSVPGGAAASVGGASMSSAQGAMASGGLLGAESGSIGGYQGQMEFTGGVLNLLAAAIAGMGSAQQAFGELGEAGEKMGQEIAQTMFGEENGNKAYSIGNAVYNNWKKETDKNGLAKGTWNTIKNVTKAGYNSFIKNDGSRGFDFLSNRAKG